MGIIRCVFCITKRNNLSNEGGVFVYFVSAVNMIVLWGNNMIDDILYLGVNFEESCLRMISTRILIKSNENKKLFLLDPNNLLIKITQLTIRSQSAQLEN